MPTLFRGFRRRNQECDREIVDLYDYLKLRLDSIIKYAIANCQILIAYIDCATINGTLRGRIDKVVTLDGWILKFVGEGSDRMTDPLGTEQPDCVLLKGTA